MDDTSFGATVKIAGTSLLLSEGEYYIPHEIQYQGNLILPEDTFLPDDFYLSIELTVEMTEKRLLNPAEHQDSKSIIASLIDMVQAFINTAINEELHAVNSDQVSAGVGKDICICAIMDVLNDPDLGFDATASALRKYVNTEYFPAYYPPKDPVVMLPDPEYNDYLVEVIDCNDEQMQYRIFEISARDPHSGEPTNLEPLYDIGYYPNGRMTVRDVYGTGRLSFYDTADLERYALLLAKMNQFVKQREEYYGKYGHPPVSGISEWRVGSEQDQDTDAQIPT